MREEPVGDIAALGHEARALDSDHAQLKLWLRMLASTMQIEAEIRRRLRRAFGVSLARFDYMAQLHRRPEGLKMRELSARLMVTGGNVTGLTDELEREGLVAREASPADRRAWIVRLTPKGRRAFETMAREHERWILELFGGLTAAEIRQLYALLGRLRAHLTQRQPSEESR
ncbi:MAG: MarR family transcriptional regulator [Burkholderiaceae bacterium]|nr:MarR family transcriptional regulator [Burkholderiaceae bacterium]